jgi:hypothetical protein
MAAQEGHLPCVQLLVEKGATVDAKDKVKQACIGGVNHHAFRSVLTALHRVRYVLRAARSDPSPLGC